MKIIHQNGYSRDELVSFRPTIYKNALESVQLLVSAMRRLSVGFVNPLNEVC